MKIPKFRNWNLTLAQKGLLLVSVPLVFELVFVGTLAYLLQQAEAEIKRESHAKEVSVATNNLLNETSGVMTVLMAMIIKHDTGAVEQEMDRLRDQMASVKDLLKDDAQQSFLLERARKEMESGNAVLTKVDELVKKGDIHGALALGLKNKRELRYAKDGSLDNLRALIDEQKKIQQESPKIQEGFRHQVELLLIIGVVANILIAISLALYFNKGTAQRLEALMANINRLDQGKPLAPPLEGTDEIARIDQVFNEMASHRRELEQMKQDFMAMVSHDLRTPLSSLQLFLYSLASGRFGEMNEQGSKYLRGAEGNITRLINLVNDLLQTARLEAGKLELNLVETKLSTIVEQSVMSVVGFAHKMGISFDVDQTEADLRADQDRVVQVVVNLLSNAVKFSPKEGTVSLSALDKGDMVEVRVADNGPGIPANMREAIFNPFQQVKVTDATEKGGTGLGLAICKGIIEAHGGSIGVESEEGKGSTFWFRIPKAPVAAQSA